MFDRIQISVAALALLLITFTAGTAFADGEGTVASAKEQTRLMSLTFSPFHLSMPVVELTGEFKAHDQWGVALIGGVGSITNESEVLGTQTYDVFEIGGQMRYYVLGDFDHGLQLGAELLYVNVSQDDIEASGATLSGSAEGIAVGPFLGYKIATDIGFTFEGQLGYQRLGLGAEARNEDTGESAADESSEWGPLLNLNVGWSF